MTTYYHISHSSKNINSSFVPRIPKTRGEREDSSIARFCVSSSIEGCLKAIPNGELFFHVLPKIKPVKVIVYEFSDEPSLHSSELVNKKLVEDALLTEECWFTEEVTPTRCYPIYILQSTFEETLYDFKILETVEYSFDEKEFIELEKEEMGIVGQMDTLLSNMF